MVIFDFLLLVTGLCVGSFLGALTYRYPKNVSILKGRSWCDSCKSQIAWYDNIPVLSYALLGGRCRNCKKKISPRYLIIEIVTGLGFLIIGPSLLNLLLFCLLFSIFIIDYEHQIIPDTFVFFGIFLVLLSFILRNVQLFPPLLAGFIAAAFLLTVFLFTKGKGMGLGDVKFAILGGLLVGLKLVAIWLFIAFVAGAVVGSFLILFKKAGLKDKVAFGPFLIAALPMTIMWGDKIVKFMGLTT